MSGDALVLGLVSDTHDNLPLVERAVAFFRERGPDRVFHLGDIMTSAAVARFEGLPVTFLRGNNDVDATLPDALAAGGHPPLVDEWSGTLAGVKVAATHGHRQNLVHRHLGRADVLLHGHTHRRRADQVGPTFVVNPGALHRCATRTVALLHLPERRVEWFEVTSEGVRPLR